MHISNHKIIIQNISPIYYNTDVNEPFTVSYNLINNLDFSPCNSRSPNCYSLVHDRIQLKPQLSIYRRCEVNIQHTVQVRSSTSRLKAIKCWDKRLMSDVILLLNHKAEGKDFITAPICSDLTAPEKPQLQRHFQTQSQTRLCLYTALL